MKRLLFVLLVLSAAASAQNGGPVVSITSPANEATFAAPANITITASATDTNNASITQVQFFAGATLIGTVKKAPYTVTWSNVGKGTYSLTAKATDTGGSSATSPAISVTVGTGNGNQPPTVSLTAPVNAAMFTAPASITVQASASDSDGTVTQVQFFAGTTLIGTSTSAPYSITWSNVAAGSYALTAKATDNGGATTTSSTVNITVGSPDVPPTVSITLPVNGATFTAPANITIQATAADSDGTVTRVQFFSGTTLIGTATSAPYTVTWSNVAAGSYALTATATDNAGLTTTSSPTSITVSGGPLYQGYLDAANCAQIGGWAWNANQPSASVSVDIYDGNAIIATTTANLFRQDLLNAGIGNGYHAFSIATPAGVQDGNTHTIAAKFSGTATWLSTSPKTVSCAVPGGTIQGSKIDGNGAVFNSPGATITLDGGAQSFGPAVNPYSASVTAGSHTVASSTPAGFAVSYSACNNCSDHTAAGGHPFVAGTSVTVNVTSGGSVDLWWKYTVADAPPTASITSPSSGASFSTPVNITIKAAASDSDGTVTKVDFFANGAPIGTVTTAPYNFTWSNVGAGTYSLTAIATDNAGLTGTSSAVSVTVNAAPVDFSTPRVDPSNRTGVPGEDLLSGNYNWSVPLVGLKGRAGLDLGVSLTYNSLIWTKSGSAIAFDADRGFPSPGFRLGFPEIQSLFFDPVVGANAYLLIMPSGSRVEVRQVGTSNIYESGDSSYIQVVDNGASGLLARMPNGTQLVFQSIMGEFHCTQVKDRNGNFITINYNSFGHISTIVDTLGRTVTFNYDGSQFNLLQSITQAWNGAQHIWATFAYGQIALQTNFTGLSVTPVQNGQSINVLTQITMADGSYFVFHYTSWGQVLKIQRFAADNHELTHVSYDLPADASVAASDCPRFTQRRDFAENWNGGAEVITSFVFDPVNLTGGQMTAPDGTQYKESYGTSTWQKGLTVQTQTISGGATRKTTTVSYTQDNTSLAFILNPRPIETNITDDAGNHRRSTTTYNTFALPSGANCSLPSDVYEYAADASTILRRTHTDYNLAQAYLNARILGLAATVSVLDGSGVLASQIGNQYDQGVQDQGSVVQHDDTNYGAAFVVGRGNLTSTQHFNVFNTGQFLQSTMVYNTAGDVISETDAAGHQTSGSYLDSFSAGTAPGQTLAYATAITDPSGSISLARYNYDNGAVTLSQDPKGAQQVYSYDPVGRLSLQTYHDSISNVDGTSTSYAYPSSLNQLQISHVVDPGLVAISTQLLDGAGRLRQTVRSLPGGTGGFSAQQFVYDTLGRVIQQSNPTEVDSTGTPAGDDASGFVFSFQQFDWAGRVILHTNQDGTSSHGSYSSCGCAGGLVATTSDETGRTTTTTNDILGRPVLVQVLNPDGTLYMTTTTVFDTLNHATSIVEQQGSSGPTETTTRTYDGFGRLATEHRPEQDPGTATVYAYNTDDTLQRVADARGAIKTLAYNGRHQITQVSYTKPNGVTAAGLTVNFSYDAAGNRVSMTDSVGSVSYTYDTWSRLLDETRSFNGISGQTFSLDYTYNLAGQLASITDPYRGQVFYAYDSAGQLTEVTGSGRDSVPTYISNVVYRAWAVPKRIVYGNGASTRLRFNSRLQVTSFNVFDSSANIFFGSTLFYNPDGRVSGIQDLDRGFDHSYTYDTLGRAISAGSGSAAGLGSTLPGPYNEQVIYDPWGNMTFRSEQLWSFFDDSISPTYANNRNTAWTYDAEGRPTQTDTLGLTYYASGQQATSTDPNRRIGTRTVPLTLSQSYDGDGLIAVQSNNGSPAYFLHSSVLGGQKVTDIAPDGTKIKGYVYADGQLLATQNAGLVQWVHRNPATNGEAASQPSGSGFRTVEVELLGNSVPLEDPNIGADTTDPDFLYPRTGDPLDLSGGCTLDGAAIPCSIASSLAQNTDAFSQDPRFLDPFQQTVLIQALKEQLLQQILQDLTTPGAFNMFALNFAPAMSMASDPNKPPADPQNLTPDDIHYDPNTGEWVMNGPDDPGPPVVVHMGTNPITFGDIWNILRGSKSLGDLTSNVRWILCGQVIPEGRTMGGNVALGAVGSVVFGGEALYNYNTGQVSAFGYKGYQVGWNGVFSANVTAGFVRYIGNDNANYQGPFTGAFVSVPSPIPVLGVGAYDAASLVSDNSISSPLDINWNKAQGAGYSVGFAALGKIQGGMSSTIYSAPKNMGNFMKAPVPGAEMFDRVMYLVRRPCQ